MKRKTLGRSCRREKKKKMKGSLARHLTVQLGQVSLMPIEHQQQNSFLDSEAAPSDSHLPSSSPLDFDLDANAGDRDFILSQDFFCTPDYITPDGQHISNSLDCNKENIPCPKSPEKLKTVRSKRQRQGKKGFEGLERSGEASSFSSRSAGEEADCSDTEVHAGPCSSSSPSQSSSCAYVYTDQRVLVFDSVAVYSFDRGGGATAGGLF